MCCLYLGTKQLLSSLPVPYLSQNFPQINHREIKERSCCIPLSLDMFPNMIEKKKKKSQNVLIWKGTTKITESSSWLCTGQPQKSHQNWEKHYYFHTAPSFSNSLHVNYSRLSSFPSAALHPFQWTQIVSSTFYKVSILPQILNCTNGETTFAFIIENEIIGGKKEPTDRPEMAHKHNNSNFLVARSLKIKRITDSYKGFIQDE